MGKLKPHIFISLIGIFVLQVYFIFYQWLIPASQINKALQGLAFTEFLVISNLALLTVCAITYRYRLLDEYLIKSNWSSFGRFLLETVLVVAIFFIVLAVFLFGFITVAQKFPLEQATEMFWKITTSKYFLSLMLYFSLTSMLLHFTSNLQNRSRTIENFISQSIGKILKPRVVKRGFIFIDLDNATTLGEELKSRQYARLLRDCFRLLNELVVFEDFEVYQYVGDEVVLSWDMELQNGDLRAIQLFIDFKAYLIENVNYFIQTYDTIPFFKCAIHSGEVVKSEIGKKTRHLVYHGDVLNTTSRILGECHRLGTDLIISKEALANKRQVERTYTLQFLPNMMFKGKSSSVDVYIVEIRDMDGGDRFEKLWKPFLFKGSMMKNYQLN